LAGAAPTVRARAMAFVGAPWAQEIGAAAAASLSVEERAAARSLAGANEVATAGTPLHRLSAIGAAALRKALAPEHDGSPFRVAGRLPSSLGRAMLGW
jgi:hypothetical protein